MKSLAVIKSIIPVFAAVQSCAVFSHPAQAHAASSIQDLTAAACEDRIDLSIGIAALEAVASATGFEQQQDELASLMPLLDQLLEDIPAGKMPEFVPAPESMLMVRYRLQTSIAKLSICFRPAREDMQQLRRDSALFTSLVKGEIYEGKLGANDDLAAEQAHNLIDNAIEADFGQHTRMLEKAAMLIKKVAA